MEERDQEMGEGGAEEGEAKAEGGDDNPAEENAEATQD